ncbi:MAG: hypothetical protein INQ03_08995 [Candidatus Heimdallarchaeota archaeon]|nr:hypothetical protein [Candidatus Heimdallarchaeota archaeon]
MTTKPIRHATINAVLNGDTELETKHLIAVYNQNIWYKEEKDKQGNKILVKKDAFDWNNSELSDFKGKNGERISNYEKKSLLDNVVNIINQVSEKK